MTNSPVSGKVEKTYESRPTITRGFYLFTSRFRHCVVCTRGASLCNGTIYEVNTASLRYVLSLLLYLMKNLSWRGQYPHH